MNVSCVLEENCVSVIVVGWHIFYTSIRSRWPILFSKLLSPCWSSVWLFQLFLEKKYWSLMTIIPERSVSPSALSVFASCIPRLHCLMFLTPHIFLWTLLASFLFASIAIAIPVIYSVQQLPVTYFLTNVLDIGLSLFSKLWVESQTDRLYKKKGEKLPSRSTSNDSLRMDCSEELQTYSGLFRDNLLVFTSLMVLRWFFFKIITG